MYLRGNVRLHTRTILHSGCVHRLLFFTRFFSSFWREMYGGCANMWGKGGSGRRNAFSLGRISWLEERQSQKRNTTIYYYFSSSSSSCTVELVVGYAMDGRTDARCRNFGLIQAARHLRPWSSWAANSDKKYMQVNGAALNVNKPCVTSGYSWLNKLTSY